MEIEALGMDGALVSSSTVIMGAGMSYYYGRTMMAENALPGQRACARPQSR
jgi:hypothetical protein